MRKGNGILRSGATAFVLGLLCATALLLSGCSGSDDDNSGISARVIDLLLDDDTIRVGEGSVLRSYFSFSSDRVFDDGANVVVVVRLPNGVTFRDGSAEIQRPLDDDSVGAQITNCPTGEQFLLFDLDSNDLDAAENPSGDADAELSLTVDGVAETTAVDIQVIARENTVNFQCGAPFAADRAVSIVVAAP